MSWKKCEKLQKAEGYLLEALQDRSTPISLKDLQLAVQEKHPISPFYFREALWRLIGRYKVAVTSDRLIHVAPQPM